MNQQTSSISQKLGADFYLQSDVVKVSQQLLGKYLMSTIGGALTGGKIVETEAYDGLRDKASHAYGNTRTKRTETMFQVGGTAYVYLCYGIHHLFNVITAEKDVPHAVLIRGLEPTSGLSVMQERRDKEEVKPNLTGGPGSLAQALGITTDYDGISLLGDTIWIEDRGEHVAEDQIRASPRVGINYAGEDAELPWRFRVKNNKWTSPAT
jgi:DNA-3-methyladenine glycosylase